MTAVHVVVPAGIDDPRQPSGGNVYDRRVCTGLARIGWEVREHRVCGSWPHPDAGAMAALADVVRSIPAGNLLLADGLIASAAVDALLPAADGLTLVVLVHLPLAVRGERAVLAAARAVVTTSQWARIQLLRRYRITPASVHVAEPGVDQAATAGSTGRGGELLCVAAVAGHKGQDVLLSALADVADLPWRCRLVGSLDRDPLFVELLHRQAAAEGIADRVEFCGPYTGSELARAYATSDLLVHPSRGETYGMVVTEALAHGVPVVAADVGGVTEALGNTGCGRPGLLVKSGEPSSLAAALRRWSTDEVLRARLRSAAGERRQTLPSWDITAQRLSRVLTEAAT